MITAARPLRSSRPMRRRNGPKGRKSLVVTCAQRHGTPSYLEFAERVNGRAAMQGFVWGAVNEAVTGNDVMEQLVTRSATGEYAAVQGDVLNAVLVVAAVALGTAITTFAPNEELEASSKALSESFTPDAELLNGRLAMVGFVILAFFT